MTIRTKIQTVLIILFCLIFGYTLWLFYHVSPRLDVQKIIQNTSLKEKKFHGTVQEVTSSQGLKAYFMQETNTQVASVSFYFDKAGYIYNKEGLASLVSNILLEGAGKYNDEAFQDLLEENGISLQFSASYDTFNGSMSFPLIYASQAAALLNMVLTEPLLENHHIKIIKEQMITALRMQNENPEKVLSKAFKKEFFGKSPRSRDSLGTEISVTSLSKIDIQDFMKTHFMKNTLKIAISGNLTPEEASQFMDTAFGSLQEKENESLENEPTVQANYHFETQNIKRDIPQTITLSVSKGTTRLSEDFYPLYIANEIFGGSGLTSRLNVITREKEGLTYGAYTYLDADRDAPCLMGHFSTSVQNKEQMQELFLKEWNKMSQNTITKKEVDAVKENMLTSFNLRFTSTQEISDMLLYMQKENLGIDFLQKRNDYVRNVTFESVNKTAQKYFKEKPSFLNIGQNNERNDLNVFVQSK